MGVSANCSQRLNYVSSLDPNEAMGSKSSYREEVVDENVLDLTIKFTESERFTSAVEKFQRKHAPSFLSVSESKNPEYDLDHTALFNEYQALLDDLFAEFSSEIGVSSTEIYQNCRDVADGKFTALFEEHENKWFVDLLMSWMNFEVFARDMCRVAENGYSSRK